MPLERKSERGVTMIEVIAACSLLAILASSTLIAIIPVSRQTRLNQELQLAGAAVRSVLEEIQSTPFNRLLERYPDDTVIPIATLPDGVLTLSYADAAADPREVHVQLNWVSAEVGPMARTYVTVRTE